MNEWKPWSFGGRESGNVEVLTLAEGAELTLTDVSSVPDWRADLVLESGDVRHQRTYVFIPDETALAMDHGLLRDAMRGHAVAHAKDHLERLRRLADAALGSL